MVNVCYQQSAKGIYDDTNSFQHKSIKKDN